MSMACTTTCSVLTGIVGQILLKIDREMHPLATPVCDTYVQQTSALQAF